MNPGAGVRGGGGRTRRVGYHQASPVAELAPLLSSERLATYERHASAWGCGAVELYLLGLELASSMQADLHLVEVLMRNSMNDQLTAVYGCRWWANSALLDDRSQTAVAKAWGDARCRQDSPPGQLIARLSFGFWVHLLEAGAYAGEPPYRQRRNYDELLWKPALHRAFPNSSGRRADVHKVVHLLYGARNRIAHHEPIIHGVRQPGVPRTAENSRRSVHELHEDIVTVVRWLSAPLGDWIATNSRTQRLLDHRGRGEERP